MRFIIAMIAAIYFKTEYGDFFEEDVILFILCVYGLCSDFYYMYFKK